MDKWINGFKNDWINVLLDELAQQINREIEQWIMDEQTNKLMDLWVNSAMDKWINGFKYDWINVLFDELAQQINGFEDQKRNRAMDNG